MNELDGHPGGSRVDPALIFGCSLLFSLVLAYPTLRGTLDGRIDIVVAGLRYLVALGFSWVALFGLFTLVSGYGRDLPSAPPAQALPNAAVQPLRRVDDVLDVRGAPIERGLGAAAQEPQEVADVGVISSA